MALESTYINVNLKPLCPTCSSRLTFDSTIYIYMIFFFYGYDPFIRRPTGIILPDKKSWFERETLTLSSPWTLNNNNKTFHTIAIIISLLIISLCLSPLLAIENFLANSVFFFFLFFLNKFVPHGNIRDTISLRHQSIYKNCVYPYNTI